MSADAKILVADACDPAAITILEEAGFAVDVKTGLTEDQIVEIIGEYDAMVVRSATKVTPKILEAGTKLKVVGRAGVGVDNIDLDAATKAGVIVENAPFGNIGSAAEHAVALLFACARNVARADRQMREGNWNKKGNKGVEISEKTLGVIGMGKVGAIVVTVAKSMKMEILVFDPYLDQAKASDMGVKLTDLDTVLSQADFLTIHTPLTDETRGLINKDRLAQMKKSARLVNGARGGIVVEEDLVDALKNGVIAGAALDVYAQEPLAGDSPLLGLDNVTLTPHLGASTSEAQQRVSTDIAHQFVAFFKQGEIQNIVNKDVKPKA